MSETINVVKYFEELATSGATEVKARATVTNEKGETYEYRTVVNYVRWPATVAEMLKKWGEDICYSMMLKQMTVDFQSKQRMLAQTGRLEELKTLSVSNVPDQKPVGDIVTKTADALKTMTKEDQQNLTLKLLLSQGIDEALARKTLGMPPKAKA